MLVSGLTDLWIFLGFVFNAGREAGLGRTRLHFDGRQAAASAILGFIPGPSFLRETRIRVRIFGGLRRASLVWIGFLRTGLQVHADVDDGGVGVQGSLVDTVFLCIQTRAVTTTGKTNPKQECRQGTRVDLVRMKGLG